MDITELIKQIPNFAGLLICIVVMQSVIKWLFLHIEQQEARIDNLVKLVIDRDNETPQPPRNP